MKRLLNCFSKKIFYFPEQMKTKKITKNIWMGIFLHYKYPSLLYVILNASKFTIDVSITYFLGKAITFQSDSLFNITLLIILRFICSIFIMGSDIYLTRCQNIRFLYLSNQIFQQAYSPNEGFSIITHDFQKIMEGEKNGLDLITAYLNVAITFIAIVLVDNTIAALCFLTTLLFSPAILWIGSKRSKLFALLNEKQKNRTKIAYTLGNFQKTYQFLHLQNECVTLLQHHLNSEIKIRNQDSFFRSLDIFIMAFGKVIPIAILLSMGKIFDIKMENYAFFLFATILSFSQLMRLCRHKPPVVQAQACISSLPILPTITSPLPPEKIILDNTWRLFKGSLFQNIFLSDRIISQEDSCLAYQLLSKLNLSTELKINLSTCAEFEIEHDGSNLSLGQKLRILILRAVFIAHHTAHKAIVVQLSLAGLDRYAIQRITDISQYLEKKHIQLMIDVPIEPSSPMEETTYFTPPRSNERINNARNLLKDYITFSWPGILFIFPVFALTLIGTLSVSPHREHQITEILLLGLTGLFLAIAIGNLIERKLRTKVALSTSQLPLQQKLSFHALMTYLTHDFQSAVQRVSWYCHDIAWLSILFLFTLFSISWEIGRLGLALLCLVGIVYFFFFQSARPLVRKAKHNLITAYQKFIGLIENNFCIGNALYWEHPTQYIRENIQNAYHILFRSSAYQQAITSLINSIISLSMGGLFIIIIAAAPFITMDASAALATAAINIDLRATILFSAIIGFTAEGISLHRLLSENTHSTPIPYQISLKQKDIFIPHLNHLSTQAFTVDNGALWQITGPSGSGKSTYLKALAEHLGTRCLYIAENWQDAIKQFNQLNQEKDADNMSLFEFIRTQYEKNLSLQVIILDEATIDLDIHEVDALIEKLAYLISNKMSCLFIVDHRISLPHGLNVKNLYQ